MSYEYHLLHILNEKGMKQTDLARLSGVSQSSINRYVSGESDIPASKLVKIARALEISVDELLQTNQPTIEEEQLLAMYRSLDRDKRELARRLIESLAK